MRNWSFTYGHYYYYFYFQLGRSEKFSLSLSMSLILSIILLIYLGRFQAIVRIQVQLKDGHLLPSCVLLCSHKRRY